MPFYAVAKGRTPGVYKSWDDCKNNIDKFSGAAFKKFNTEAECKQFIAAKGGDVPQRDVASTGYCVVESTPMAPKNYAASSSYNTGLVNLGASSNRSSAPHHVSAASKNKIGRYEYETDESDFVHVYTDGSCANNGQKDAKAGLGVYFGENHPLNVSEPVRGRPTNNSGEIQAAITAIKVAKEQGLKKLCINTDSEFVINSMTKWVPGWKAKDWKLADGGPVKNEHDFKELDRLYRDESMDIKWNYVKAHNGTLGNERADELAKDGAARYK